MKSSMHFHTPVLCQVLDCVRNCGTYLVYTSNQPYKAGVPALTVLMRNRKQREANDWLPSLSSLREKTGDMPRH